jgi:Fic family protein
MAQQLSLSFEKPFRFNGSDYESAFDDVRLTGQLKLIYSLMIDGKWRTLGEIEAITKAPQSSISAQLRHLRKDRFGNHTVNKRPRGDRSNGLFEYQLLRSH